tara:strand:+ start:987 stop:1343 length:357 start_codon:yes stop_codon:yes gene_type:complete
MAIHKFNYTYEYVGVQTTPLSQYDDTAIVTEITVAVTAKDQEDSAQTLTENFSKVFSPFVIQDTGIPENFISINSLTDNQVINWYKDIEDEERLNAIFTWKIYGPEEVDTITGDTHVT